MIAYFNGFVLRLLSVTSEKLALPYHIEEII